MGNCLKYLKRGWNRGDGEDTKILKRRGGKLGGRGGMGALIIKRGVGTPTNYGVYVYVLAMLVFFCFV